MFCSSFMLFIYLEAVGFELIASCLLGRRCYAWPTPPVQ
jgi:hypothetical protein